MYYVYVLTNLIYILFMGEAMPQRKGKLVEARSYIPDNVYHYLVPVNERECDASFAKTD